LPANFQTGYVIYGVARFFMQRFYPTQCSFSFQPQVLKVSSAKREMPILNRIATKLHRETGILFSFARTPSQFFSGENGPFGMRRNKCAIPFSFD
jgi:hypothetical protein